MLEIEHINGTDGNDTLLAIDDVVYQDYAIYQGAYYWEDKETLLQIIEGDKGNDFLHGVGILNGGEGDDLLIAAKYLFPYNYEYWDSMNEGYTIKYRDSYLVGGVGDDVLMGVGSLDGGSGDDLLIGSMSSHFVFSAGHTLIDRAFASEGNSDHATLQFGNLVTQEGSGTAMWVNPAQNNIALNDIVGARSGTDLILQVKKTETRVRVVDFFEDPIANLELYYRDINPHQYDDP